MAASEYVNFVEENLNDAIRLMAELKGWTPEDEGELNAELLTSLAELRIYPTTKKLNKIMEILDLLIELKSDFLEKGHADCGICKMCNLFHQYNRTVRTLLDTVVNLFETHDESLLNWMIDLEYPLSVKLLLELADDLQYVVKEFYRFQDLVFSALVFYDHIAFNRSDYTIVGQKKELLLYILSLGTTFSSKTANHDMPCFPLHSYLCVDLLLIQLFKFDQQLSEIQISNNRPVYLAPLHNTVTYIGRMLPALPPVRLSEFQHRCQEMDIDYATVLTSIERLAPLLPLLKETTSREPCALKHLCRTTIRNHLFLNWTLPINIDFMYRQIPRQLQSFLLLEDEM